jgi:hypothetical protein
MVSLKSYTERLAPLVGTTAAALYERQRALVRSGLLNQGMRRGPGSGTRATSESVALLLIATLAADALTDAAKRTAEISGAAKKLSSGRCKLTGKQKFSEALAALLTSKSLSEKIVDIYVSRSTPEAYIRYKKDGEKVRSSFGVGAKQVPVTIGATLDGTVVQKVASDVIAMLGLKRDSNVGKAKSGRGRALKERK